MNPPSDDGQVGPGRNRPHSQCGERSREPRRKYGPDRANQRVRAFRRPASGTRPPGLYNILHRGVDEIEIPRLKNTKSGVMIYWSTFDTMDTLAPGQERRLWRAIRAFGERQQEPDFSDDPQLNTVWTQIRPVLKLDDEKCRHVSNVRRWSQLMRWWQARGLVKMSFEYWQEYADAKNVEELFERVRDAGDLPLFQPP